MKFQFHNKVEITFQNKTYTYFNKMLPSVFDELKNFKSFFSHIALGVGNSFNFNESSCKLTNHFITKSAICEKLQNNICNGTPFIKKSITITKNEMNNKYITELGITNSTEANPTIFNYISLISNEFPIGISPSENEEVLISVYLYLDITSGNNCLLTGGNNKFISFLLGNGLDENIYAARGNNLSTNNISLFCEQPILEKTLCNIQSTKLENFLTFTFSADLSKNKTYEVKFLTNNHPFARLNLLDFKPKFNESLSIFPKECYVLDLGEDISNITSIINNSNNSTETGCFTKQYAKEFGDKISVPFFNYFNNQTPRFLSKDDNKIFFVNEDSIFGYLNQNYQLNKLDCGDIIIDEISNIISFDNFIFIASNKEPYLSCYLLDSNNTYNDIKLDTSSSDFDGVINDILHIDITISHTGILMISIIAKSNNHGYTYYYKFDNALNNFKYDSFIKSEHNFSYILSMYKNNFTDARVMFLEEGEYSSDCRLVTHFADKTFEDIYTVLSYFYTKDTKQLYTKNRGVIVEKTTSPKLKLFYYPQVYEYELPLISDEDDNFISTNLLYLIQKRGEKYSIFNLIGYNEPKEFDGGFPTYINQSKILDFEFLDDTLLIFMDDENEPIIALNLKLNGTLVENISSIDTAYTASVSKYDIVGKNEGVIATFMATISLWYFLTK